MVAGPIVAALALATVIGIPVGLTVLFVVLPMLLLLGAVVSATWLGLLILGRQDEEKRPARPIAAAVLGLAIMLAVMLVPALGFFAMALFALWGMGALTYRIITGAPPAPVPAAAVEIPSPAPPEPED